MIKFIKDSINRLINPPLEPSKEPSNTYKRDGWSNILSGLGANNGRVNSTRYNPSFRLDRNMLTHIYTSDGIGRRIVNILVDDAMRCFIECDIKLTTELQRIKSKQRMIEAASWARLYGGSLLIAFVDDGQEMDQPLNFKGLKRLVSLRSYDRYQVTWVNSDLSINFYEEHYGSPEIYTISPINGVPFRVHRSRCHMFNGERIPEHEKVQNNYWDSSILQAVYDSLRNYGSTMNASAEIVQDFVQVVIGIAGLTNMLMQGSDEEIIKRGQLLDLTRSVSNSLFYDSETETYTKHASSIAGLPELWDRFSEAISASTGIPVTKLFGRSAAGLNSTGDNDIGNWNDIVDAYRGDEIEPCINWLIDILKAQSMWDSGKKPENYDWEFPALKAATEEEMAKIKLTTAQVDQIYMDRGAIDPTYLFELRYADGKFQSNIVIDKDEYNKWANENSSEIEVDPDNMDLSNNKMNKEDSAKEKLYTKILENL